MRRLILLLLCFLFITPLSYAKQTGEIHLYCKPNFRVYIDGNFVGKTNSTDSGIFITKVPAGRRSIRLMKKGKSNEVLIFSVNQSLTEIESNKYSIGKFSKTVRNSKLIKEYVGILPQWGKHITWKNTDLELSEYIYEKEKLKIFDAIASNLYIPSFNEDYDVDTLPRMVYMESPIFPILDTPLTLTHSEVWVKGLVDPNGNVDTVVVVGSCGNEHFDNMAYDAALESIFLPAIKDNKNAWVWVSWQIPYRDIYLGVKELGHNKNKDNLIQQYLSKSLLLKDKSMQSGTVPSNNQILDELPIIVTSQLPLYPPKMLQAGIDGTVWIKGLVSSKGDVVDANVGVSSGYPELDSAAVKAAREYYFLPAEKNGVPVDAVIAWDIVFDKNNPNVEKPSEEKESFPENDAFVPIDILPEMIRSTAPKYPRLAKQKGLEGIVWVKALVDKTGKVRKARIGKSSGVKVLDKAAVVAAFGNHYKPASQSGRPIAVWVTYKVDFKLND